LEFSWNWRFQDYSKIGVELQLHFRMSHVCHVVQFLGVWSMFGMSLDDDVKNVQCSERHSETEVAG
jgi:hypothetical protein